MTNVLLTERCVRSCPYGFAGGRMAEAGGVFLARQRGFFLASSSGRCF
jgi:hypothetical protein